MAGAIWTLTKRIRVAGGGPAAQVCVFVASRVISDARIPDDTKTATVAAPR